MLLDWGDMELNVHLLMCKLLLRFFTIVYKSLDQKTKANYHMSLELELKA